MTTLASPLALDDAALDLLFRDARSVNAFAEREVDPAEIQAAYDLLRWAPTAMNTSPLRLAVVPRGRQRERLASHMSEGNRAKTLAAPLTVVAASDPAFHTHLDVLAPHRTGLAESLEPQAERREGMARTNALIQVGYLVLALRSRGLHVGPMGGFDTAGVDADLLADQGWRSQLVLNVGWEAAEGGIHPRAARLEASDAVAVL
ncbi:malonic semialdehyde reductase [Serinibacter arcticus]|uniref:Malonic semialdehyde reductase n=1 Tax=Serinibacter arcticus TaxID=1655435 RepID=A0A2U1ZU24_9MICO|nr:malonic semialdehyde reductase [Serinibacter arcticus]PWD50432.1 malonic semialdehyde reductase [Serinibacter arcticus]